MRYYEKRGWQLMDNLPYAKDLSPMTLRFAILTVSDRSVAR